MADLTASQARIISTSDQTIYNEIDAIMRATMTAALAGELNVSIDDGTAMTESTPTITVLGTVADPVIGIADETITLAGQTITLFGLYDVNQIVAAINDASIPGMVASKNANQQIMLTYNTPQDAWSLAIGAGTGNISIGLTESNITADEPASVSHYNVWSGQEENRKRSFEYTQVVTHMQDLGFNILAKKNITTNKTFTWEIYW